MNYTIVRPAKKMPPLGAFVSNLERGTFFLWCNASAHDGEALYYRAELCVINMDSGNKLDFVSFPGAHAFPQPCKIVIEEK